ncbi:MAG TPA: adenylate/guanylate cyclase domain-containing protein [Candidatus Dormibacteraeota bacterium]|nr:adenylate/guanylate cyclase domain-containing protein [Candidatus Dormibacteraeota bacterium]
MVRERVGDWRSAWRSALAGLAAGLLAIGVLQTGILDGPFFAAQDRLFPAPPPDNGITLVAVDARSKTQLGAYPWSNGYHAQVINYLASLHPKVILVDLLLNHSTIDPELLPPPPHVITQQDLENARTDNALAQAIKAAGNVVLVCTSSDGPIDALEVGEPIGDLGFGPPDPANAIRGMSLKVNSSCSQNESGETAFVQALRIAEKNQDPISFNDGAAQFGKHRIPLTNNQMLINYTLGGSPTCSYIDAFNAACPHPEFITNHIVVIGTKLIDAGDVYSQPVSFKHDASFCPSTRKNCMLDNQNYGYRMMGDAMATVLQDRYVQVEPANWIFGVALLLAIVVGLAVYALGFRAAIIATVSLLGLYFIAALVFSQQNLLIDPLYAPIAMVLAASFSLGARYVLVERERRKVERIFGQYVDPRISRQLADSRSIKDVTSRGERRELTLVFVDIRGFTAMSEQMRAEDVLAVIQEYLNEMSALILKWDGTIDKYVGDEIVAIWNAPTHQPHHALWAVRCAYDLINQASVVQSHLAAKGLPPISWGIGINTGPAVVGNMGSRDRLQYTALGDTVNTAARFCSVAPAFTVLIGESTYQECRDYIAVEQVPGLQLKGKSADKFRVYQVVSIREEPSSPWVPFPTELANDTYTSIRRSYGAQLVFAASTPGDIEE